MVIVVSYILGALRKAEQERGDELTLSSVVEPFAPQQSNSPVEPFSRSEISQYVFLFVVVAVLLGLVYWLFGFSLPSSDSERSSVVAKHETLPIIPPATLPETSPAASPKSSQGFSDPIESSYKKPLPELNVTGYLFFPDQPSRSKLFIDGVVYRQGSRVVPGLTIENFAPRHVVLSWQGESHHLSVH